MTTPAPPPAGGLDDHDLAILDFERQWWLRPGAREQAIRDRFGVSLTVYTVRLLGLLRRDAALAADPILVRRLRGVAVQHRGIRSR